VLAANAALLLRETHRSTRAVLPPLPFERSAELVHVWQKHGGHVATATSYPKLDYLRRHSRTLDVAFGSGGELFWERADLNVRLGVWAVTPNYFDVLRVRPILTSAHHRHRDRPRAPGRAPAGLQSQRHGPDRRPPARMSAHSVSSRSRRLPMLTTSSSA
jgi:hypothetical protein